jgi:DNA/RNA-binding domain of Phe-tRNA-synthetase-like protein
MRNIHIDDAILDLVPSFAMAVLELDVRVFEHPELDDLIANQEADLSQRYDISDVIHLPFIRDGRDAYKAFGKDPSRYRLAVESLYRRIVKGNRLYRINNVVDAGNVLSLIAQKSVAVLDDERVNGDVTIRLGRISDEFYGIGRGRLSIDRIPVYVDSIGPFGSTTSDTERTMIRPQTTKVLLFILSFSGPDSLSSDIDEAIRLYTKYCEATIRSSRIIQRF